MLTAYPVYLRGHGLKKTLRITIKYIAIFLFMALLFVTILIGAAKIPEGAIQEKMLESGSYYNSKQQVDYLISDIRCTQLHYSADATWMSIAYNMDSKHPLESSMWAYYSSWPQETSNGSFYQSVLHEQRGDQQYLRYWHGPIVIIRAFHTFCNIQQIYLLLVLILASLFVTLCVLLLKNHMFPEMVAIIIALGMVSIWVVPLCLEYVWMFLIMFISSIIGINIALSCHYEKCTILFFLTGIVAVFFDFLTTETITLLIPLMFILRIHSRQSIMSDNSSIMMSNWNKEEWILTIKSCTAWVVGFLGMWAMKWLIAAMVLKQNVMPYISEHVYQRINGGVGLTFPHTLIQSVIRNIGRLFVFDYGIIGLIVFFVLILSLIVIPVLFNKVTIKTCINKSRILLFLTLGVLPYVRFLVLHNHSYGHYCFTYRAQAASVLALCFIILELIERNPRKEEPVDEER